MNTIKPKLIVKSITKKKSNLAKLKELMKKEKEKD